MSFSLLVRLYKPVNVLMARLGKFVDFIILTCEPNFIYVKDVSIVNGVVEVNEVVDFTKKTIKKC